MDVETAFLYGNLDEEAYMQIPSGHQEVVELIDEKYWCLELKKSIYGLVQAARQWWKRLVEVLKELGFQQSAIDACLLCRMDDDGIVIFCIYVDDILCVGSKIGIEKTIKKLSTKFQVKRVGELNDYVGCTILRNGREKKALFYQGDLIARLEKDFSYELENFRRRSTPAIPREIVMKSQEGDLMLSEDEQRKY